jgi:hypothetical protein
MCRCITSRRLCDMLKLRSKHNRLRLRLRLKPKPKLLTRRPRLKHWLRLKLRDMEGYSMHRRTVIAVIVGMVGGDPQGYHVLPFLLSFGYICVHYKA